MTFNFLWASDSQVVVSVVTLDGAAQANISLDLATAQGVTLQSGATDASTADASALAALSSIAQTRSARVKTNQVSAPSVIEKREALPYGSRFIHNACRSRWELRSAPEPATEDQPATLTMAFYHRKANDDWLRPPFAWQAVFHRRPSETRASSVGILPGRLADSPALLERASLPVRIRAVLATGARTIEALAEALAAKRDTIEKALHRMPDVVKLTTSKPYTWGLKADR